MRVADQPPVSARIRAFALIAVCLSTWAMQQAPTLAASADPGRSKVEANAPVLAPGTWGAAPLWGDVDATGTLLLRTNIDSVTTGSVVYDRLLRQFVKGSLTLSTTRPSLVRRHGRITQMRAKARVQGTGGGANVSLLLRYTQVVGGLNLSSYFSLPLAPLGVMTATGGNPGSVRVAITAFFPGAKAPP